MKNIKVCRLCCDACLESNHNLFENNGECTEIYEVTVKYFDPMLLANDSDDDSDFSQSNVMCQRCWKHIREFHLFQQNVLAQHLIEGFKTELVLSKEVGDTHNNRLGNKNELFQMELAKSTDKIEGILQESVANVQYSTEGGEVNDEESEDNCMPNELENKKIESANVSPKIQDSSRHPFESKYFDNADGRDNICLVNGLDKSEMVSGLAISLNDNPHFSENFEMSAIEDRSLGIRDNVDVKNDPTTRNREKTHIQRKTRRNKVKLKDKETTKKSSYNSAEKLQELDDFISEVKPDLECDICKICFNNYNALRLHFKQEHQKKCYVICCNKKIVRRYLLVEHLRLHVNPEIYKCSICGANSNSSRTLQIHKRFMHETEKNHECEICQRKFKNKTILSRHMATHAAVSKDYKCDQCGRFYAFKFQLKIHTSKVHNEQVICDQCGKMMNGGSAALKQHILLQHSGNARKWSCEVCDAQLSSNKSLKSHKLSFHNDGTTAFICVICNKVAASENALMRHKKFVHEMERKFKCTYTYCQKAFKNKTNLKEHIATHTGQHLYQCPHCSQTFNNNANMHKHRKRTHPVEWAQSRENRIVAPKVKPGSVIKEILL